MAQPPHRGVRAAGAAPAGAVGAVGERPARPRGSTRRTAGGTDLARRCTLALTMCLGLSRSSASPEDQCLQYSLLG